MQILVEDERYELHPNDLCIIAPGKVHYVQVDGATVGMGFRFSFSDNGKAESEDATLFSRALVPSRNAFLVSNCEVFEKYVLHASENMKSAGSPFITASLLFLALYDLADRILKKEYPENVGLERSSDVALSEDIENYINSNYNRKIQLSDIAAHINLCTRQTERIIKKLFGMTYGELLCQKRLAVARFLLRTTSQSLDEIAQSCGFEDKSYFCRRFHSTFGIAPGKYREKKANQ